jgi:phenylacetate-CoA ligase
MVVLLEKIRKSMFWIFDKLKGGKIRFNYDDVTSMLENYNSDHSIEKRDLYLRNILEHATATTPFYKKFSHFKSLGDFPVINKNIIRNELDNFLSVKFSKSKLHKVTTSGSTGTPFTVYHDQEKRTRHVADTIYFLEKAGYSVGQRLYYTRVWNSINRKNPITAFLENVQMEEIAELTPSYTAGLIKRLENDRSTKTLLAFASTYEALVANLNTLKITKVKADVSCIVSMSESLPAFAKKQLMDIFNCPVVSRYSNMENGFLGQEFTGDTGQYQINSASYHIEILNLNEDVPVTMGQLGRIVVTDLFNKAMPLIRYDTGDIASMAELSRGSVKEPVLSKIEGRIVDFIYSTKDTLLSPHVITNSMWKYPDVRQFQFIQLNKVDYNLKLNIEPLTEKKEMELRADLMQYVGDDANISIDYVDDIPLLASGKRKKIINLMKRNNAV